MKVSIITPVYNEPRIQQTVESILSQQDVPDLEITVVDGESTDQTPEIIEDYADCIDVLIRESDDGVYDAMNKGISELAEPTAAPGSGDDRTHT